MHIVHFVLTTSNIQKETKVKKMYSEMNALNLQKIQN